MGRKLTAKEEMDKLRAALIERGTKSSVSLAERMTRCAVDWNGHYECRSPGCWHCRRRHIAREQRVVQNWFGHLENADLGFVSVVVGATSSVDGIGDLIRKSRESTRKRIAACRAQSPTWNGVYLAGWHEIDAVGAHHLPLLPTDRRPLIENIAPLSFGSNAPAWITTWHGIMNLNDMPVEQVAYEFRRQWKLDGQVKVKPFHSDKPVAENLNFVTSYSNKFQSVVTLKDYRPEPWPFDWKAEFFGWLQGVQRNPFEALRFSVNPRLVQPTLPPQCDSSTTQRRDAMPCLFSRVPTYEYTGPRP